MTGGTATFREFVLVDAVRLAADGVLTEASQAVRDITAGSWARIGVPGGVPMSGRCCRRRVLLFPGLAWPRARSLTGEVCGFHPLGDL